MRTPAANRKPRLAKSKSYPAPVRGWIANENLAVSTPQGAAVLDNWFPTATGARMRGGSDKHATIGDGTDPVEALFSFKEGNTQFLFGATGTDIYDITSVADPDVSPTAEVSSLAGGNWVFVQFTTSGGTFLRGVNGEDTPLVFDGATWGTTPALTGATPEDLNYVWAYKNRLFFIEKDCLDAYYLAVDTLGGALTILPLGAVFSLGGSLLFGATWSLDSGSGLSEQCVFVTTEGEVAVYQGSDPGDADNWSKVGVYRIGKPLGSKAWIRAGGDLVIATDIGFVPLSQAIQRDLAALSPSAVSFPIETAWNEAVAERGSEPWHCEVWPTNQMVVVAIPTEEGQSAQMFVANARTGAWGKYSGWNGTCLEVFDGRLFFGSVDGKIIEAEITGMDEGAPYTATYVPLFDDLKTPASLKTAQLARAVLLAPTAVNERLSVQKDYIISLPTAPDAATESSGSVWGTGTWGTSVWGGNVTKTTYQNWRSVPGSGYALAPSLQITSGSISPLDVELVRVDLTYDYGDIVS